MCGLTGFWTAERRVGDPRAALQRMSDAIVHRGPDSEGAWLEDGAGMALGHRRLAIIDLSSAGAQPMASPSGRFVIAFNGEIYNHLDLRQELQSEGRAPAWRGHSDTETLLAAIEAWDLAPTLQRCVGMFAIALWDLEEHCLRLARDRLGEKPLYYGWTGAERAFVFGSELKSLRAYPSFDNEIDRNALAAYFQYSVVPTPLSIYRGIGKLRPGCILRLDSSDLVRERVTEEAYWDMDAVVSQGAAMPFAADDEAVTAVENALRQAVATQAIADVPLGAFLSGGVDSSTIVALMQSQSSRPVKTFTIGFDDATFDEAPYAAAVAAHLRTDHHEMRVTAADALAVIPALPRMYDEPFADSSQIPTALVCRAARAHVTVALSGDAGDELFGGYNRYLWGPKLSRRVRSLPEPMLGLAAKAMQAASQSALDRLGAMLPGRYGVARLGAKIRRMGDRLQGASSIERLYGNVVKEWPSGSDLVKGAVVPSIWPARTGSERVVDDEASRMMYWDAKGYLPDDILTKVDRAAMAVGLETRVPLLDHRVVETAWRVPPHMKIRAGRGKWILREVLYRHVPQRLIDRPKAGFAIPLEDWLRGPLREWAEALLDPVRLESEGFLDVDLVRKTWSEHLAGRQDWSGRLWSVLMFEAWLEANS